VSACAYATIPDVLKITSPTAYFLTRVDWTPELEIPPTFVSFTVEIPNTLAFDRSVRKTGNVVVGVVIGVVVAVLGLVVAVLGVVVAVLGAVVAVLGVVVTVVGAVVTTLGFVVTVRVQVKREFVVKEIPELQAPNPFRFLARTRTLKVFPAATALTVHLVAARLAVHVFVPTFASVCRIGDFEFVLAIEKLTDTSTVPLEDFADARID
jgi:hypothetical protein